MLKSKNYSSLNNEQKINKKEEDLKDLENRISNIPEVTLFFDKPLFIILNIFVGVFTLLLIGYYAIVIYKIFFATIDDSNSSINYLLKGVFNFDDLGKAVLAVFPLLPGFAFLAMDLTVYEIYKLEKAKHRQCYLVAVVTIMFLVDVSLGIGMNNKFNDIKILLGQPTVPFYLNVEVYLLLFLGFGGSFFRMVASHKLVKMRKLRNPKKPRMEKEEDLMAKIAKENLVLKELKNSYKNETTDIDKAIGEIDLKITLLRAFDHRILAALEGYMLGYLTPLHQQGHSTIKHTEVFDEFIAKLKDKYLII